MSTEYEELKDTETSSETTFEHVMNSGQTLVLSVFLGVAIGIALCKALGVFEYIYVYIYIHDM